ncbi:MAG: hypothetical protein ABI588_02750 [Arenimonas sp.]
MLSHLRLFIFPLALLLAACGGMPHKKVDTVGEYGNAVRWSEWDQAWNFTDPATRKSATLPESELDRLKAVKISGYEVRSKEPQADGTLDQTVEIRYVEQATQVEKSIRDHQVWRTDDEGEHWWLTTGLPEF